MSLRGDVMKSLQHPGLPLGERIPNRSHWRSWNRGIGLAMFTGLAALSGATCVIVLHRLQMLPARTTETGSLQSNLLPRASAISLAQSVLMRLDDANRSGNYEIFRRMSAPGFQSINSAADLAQIFGWLRKEGVVLDAVRGLDAEALRIETIEPRGLLRLTGDIAATPEPLRYDIMLQMNDGDWRLFGIAVFKG